MSNKLYAFDFDGVICDSAVETGLTGWKVAKKIWPDMPDDIPTKILSLFRDVRPIMETGYEAAIIVRLLQEGRSAETLLSDFSDSMSQVLRRDELDIDELKVLFGETRDNWIAEELDHWITMNPLFEGIAEKLRSIDPTNCYIITTKQERFVKYIFEANAISLLDEHIFGLDRKLTKQNILLNITRAHPNSDVIFVEDRLPTLTKTLGDDRLDKVKLYLANWGYNTDQDKSLARDNPKISTISLNEMSAL
jgi:phosphoglycolate phosphatase-like HAD superfamily hydrolase